MTALATDIGGTFTDVVLAADGRVHVAKTLTTPADPTEGLLRGVRQVLDAAGVDPASVRHCTHATTLATNVILQRRGVPVAFVTTRGFGAAPVLGRRARVEEERYDLAFCPDDPPVPPSHIVEVPERLAADGSVVTPLDDAAARRVAARVADLGVAAVAICLLHAHVNDAHEKRLAALIADRLPSGTPVVTSSEIWPEPGEYDRAMTTLMSAYVGPVMTGYLGRLRARLGALGVTAPLHVMDSAGGVLPAALAAARPVRTIESGPAAGVIAAARAGAPYGPTDLISFDMGGTTAKAGLVRDGRPGVTHDFQVGGSGSFGGRRPGTGIPVKGAAIDLAEVGAGGGSIAWLDAGVLRVGPRSAGAEPGPACYGRGGTLPTVTDADLVLGYLDPDGFGDLRLRTGLAEEAIARHVAGPLGVTVAEAAAAIHAIADDQMGAAVHVVTVRRGIDPRGCTLVALGGAAPTHAAGIAARFGIGRVLVPARCGVGSAAGLLHADLSTERSCAFPAPADGADPAALETVLAGLEAACRADLGVTGGEAARAVGIRFTGQAHAFTVDLDPGPVTRATIDAAVAGFHARYREAYGIDPRGPAELTAARVRLRVPAGAGPAPSTGTGSADGAAAARRAWFAGAYTDVPVRERAACAPGERIAGPHIVTEPQASLVVPPGWHGTVDDRGAILLENPALRDGTPMTAARPVTADRTAPAQGREAATVVGDDAARPGHGTAPRPPGEVPVTEMPMDRTGGVFPGPVSPVTATAAGPGTVPERTAAAGSPGAGSRARGASGGRAADAAGALTAEIFRNALRTAAEEASIVVVRSAYSTFIVEGADAAAAILDARGRLIAHSTSTALIQCASLRSALPYVIDAFPLARMRPGDVFCLNDVYQGGIHANDLLVFRPVFIDDAAAYFTGTLIHVADLSGLSAGGMASDATDVYLEGLQLPPVRLATADGWNDDLTRLLAANSRTPDKLLGDVRALVAGANVAARRLTELAAAYDLADGVETYLAHTEARMRAELARLPAGTYRGEYPVEDGEELRRVRVAVTLRNGGARVDFAGTDPQVPRPVNSGFSQTLGGVMYALRCFVDPSLPMNEGCFAPLEVRMPAGSLVNCTRPHPGGGRWGTVAAAEEAIFAALTRALPGRGSAASGILQGYSVSGAGRPWLHMSFEFGGMGARSGRDGPDATGALFGGGRNIIPQAEPIEARLPVRIEEVSLIPDSGGSGRWRGGRGTRTVIRMLEDARVDTRGDRLAHPPPGAAGGGPGRGGGYFRERRDGTREPLPPKATGLPLRAGEALVVETSGGGGYGAPVPEAAGGTDDAAAERPAVPSAAANPAAGVAGRARAADEGAS